MYDPARDAFPEHDGSEVERGEGIRDKKSLNSKPKTVNTDRANIESSKARPSPSVMAQSDITNDPTNVKLNSSEPKAKRSHGLAKDEDETPSEPPAKKTRVGNHNRTSGDAGSVNNDTKVAPHKDQQSTTVSTLNSHGSKQKAEKSLSPARKRKRSRSRSRSPRPQSSKGGASESRGHRTNLPSAYARRSPTPPPRSPPRERKRPGGASRMTAVERENGKRIIMEREKAQMERAKREAAHRGVSDVVRQHYNAVPERGREWRATDSRIKGLRSFNNWVKSAIIQNFSPDKDFRPADTDGPRWSKGDGSSSGLKVLDIGCGKGGDLGKWAKAPQRVELYVGVDPADVSITQARERYRQLKDGGGRGGRRGGRDNRDFRNPRVFHAEFYPRDAFSKPLGDIPIVQEVGFDSDAGGAMSQRWGGGGFDVVSMMFCMHYAFETEEKARGMLRNVAGSLKKGGRLIGTIPNSDVISERAIAFHKALESKQSNPDASNGTKTGAENVLEWSNSIYKVRFPGDTPSDGIFRPIYGWKYNFFLEEAVEEVPEYVVPFGAFRSMAEDYNLDLRYMKPFADVWKENKDDPELGRLSEQMRVCDRDRHLLLSNDETEATNFYIAFVMEKS